MVRDIGAVAAACTTEDLKNPSGVWGQTAPTRVWAAPTVLRLGLVLSPESGRGEATYPRAVGARPLSEFQPCRCGGSGGNPRCFACGFGSAWFYARQQERRPASFAGLLPCAGRCEDGSRSGTAEAFTVLTTHRNPAPGASSALLRATMLLGFTALRSCTARASAVCWRATCCSLVSPDMDITT